MSRSLVGLVAVIALAAGALAAQRDAEVPAGRYFLGSFAVRFQ